MLVRRLGYSGLYSSLLLYAQKVAKQFDVDERDLLIKIGPLKTVSEQEDLIYEAAKNQQDKRKRRESQ